MKSLTGSMLLLFSSLSFAADPSVTDAWVAATAPGQQTGGAYMNISSEKGAKLVGAESPVAREVMVHSMTMKNGVMEMRSIKDLDIPAGKTVNLAPGKMHLMLMDLKKRLESGDRVPLKLTFVQGGKKSTLDVEATVKNLSSRMEMY